MYVLYSQSLFYDCLQELGIASFKCWSKCRTRLIKTKIKENGEAILACLDLKVENFAKHEAKEENIFQKVKYGK